ncbi:MAG: urease accessory protein UreF [Devosia sp.]|uniref:urease accessory protein UreF n=1 Tax=Devosia sp. TaxID=1871048 RepID=UPI001AD5E916|nr:urease accessory protein UreF [Devosia sp.]MBN9316521.1 urease accessory protein UreF [Devosia sp.]
MTDPAALQKLVTWLSPAFPVGAFAWSAGLETAIADRRVTDSERLRNWIEGALAHGGIHTDSIVLAEAWRVVRDGATPVATPLPTSPTRGEVWADASGTFKQSEPAGTSPLVGEVGRGEATRAALSDLSDLALALTPSRERWLETTITGDNYALAARHWPSGVLALLPQPCPYPVAVGAIAAAHGIDLEDTLLAWLTATVHGQVSVAVRLVPLGQSDGLKVMSGLEPCVAALAKSASTATLADIGAIAYAADIAQMRHETLEPRIFRS